MIVAFQMFYTTLFGGYAAFIFMRTGHLASAIVCHAFCNMMGFPDLSWLEDRKRRVSVGGAYLAGIVVFSFLVVWGTDPALYGNSLTYAQLEAAPPVTLGG